MYHGEEDQEDFLVLYGECLLIVEGEERRLEAWDFVHCPPYTRHVFVGAGDGPCAILMVGGRRGEGSRLPGGRDGAEARRRGERRRRPNPRLRTHGFRRTPNAPYRDGDLPASYSARR